MLAARKDFMFGGIVVYSLLDGRVLLFLGILEDTLEEDLRVGQGLGGCMRH